MAFSVSYTYKIQDLYSGKLAKIRKATDRFRSATTKAQKATSKFANKMTSAQTALSGVGIGFATVFPIKQAMKFESVMADIKKVVDFKTPEQFEQLKSQIMGASEAMGRMPVDIAQIAVSGGKLGILPENMGQFINTVSKSAIAFDSLEGVMGDQIASIANKLNVPINKMGEMMDAVNFLADNTAASGKRMVEIIARTSGVMSTIKMPKEFIAGWAAFADQVEVTPQLAASGLRMMINRMKGMKGGMKKILADPTKAIKDYLVALRKVEPVKRAKQLKKMFGDEAGRFAEKAVNRLELLDKTMLLVANKTNFMGSMQKELQVKLKTTAVKLARLKAAFLNTAIIIGTAALPALRAISDRLFIVALRIKNFTKAHPELSKMILLIGGAAVAFLAILIPLGLIAGAISPLIGGFGTLIGLLPKMMGLFKATTVATSSLGMVLGAPVAKIGFFAKALAFLMSPAVLITGAIVALVGGLAFLAIKSQKVRDSLGGLWEALKIIFEPFKALFDLFPGATSVLSEIAGSFDFVGVAASIVSGLIDGLTVAVKLLLIPFKILAGLIKIVGSVGGAVFKGITGEKGISNELGEMAFGGKRAIPKKPVTGKDIYAAKIKEILARKAERTSVAADFAKAQQGTINGGIDINVSGPGKVKKANMESSFPGDLGFNMAGAG